METEDLSRLTETKYIVTLVGLRAAKILLIILVVWGFIRLMKAVSRRIVERARDDDHTTQNEREKRAETLAQVLNAASQIFALTIGLFMTLRELGFSITPLLTGAGIVGVALGLGAQSIVRDFLNGFFILMENQFRLGDIVRINGAEGEVEKITLRTTMLRDIDGGLHIIPNGEIKAVRNATHGWARVRLDVGVPYEADLGRALAILREVGEGLAADPVHGPALLERPEVLGVESFGDSQITVRVIAKTVPNRLYDTAREFRRRVKLAFDAGGIGAPHPRRVVISGPDGS